MHFSLRKKPSLPMLALLILTIGTLGFLYVQEMQAFKATALAAPPTITPTAIAKVGGEATETVSRIQAGAPRVEVFPPFPPENESDAAAQAAAEQSPAAQPLAGAQEQALDQKVLGQQTLDVPSTASRETQALQAAPSETRAAGSLFDNPYFVFLVGAGVSILLFLNFFKVEPSPPEVLGSDVFRTLSSDTRVEMLHALNQRRKTLSELAKEAEISLPGAKQHLERLEEAGLVRKLDEGRKWKYYELTGLGKRIILEKLA